jgi:hypothetical protein
MTTTTLLVGGFSLLISVLGYFLVKFDKQVERMANNVEQIKINQAVDSEKLKQFETRIETLEKILVKKI